MRRLAEAKRLLRAGRARVRSMLNKATRPRPEPAHLARPARVAVVGSGRAGEYHLEALSCLQGATIACLANRGGTTAATLRQRFDIPRYFPSIDELLRHDDLFDAAILAVSVGSTADVSARFIDRGKPCLIEKPLARSVSEATRLRALAADPGAYAVGYNRRFYSSVRSAMDFVRALGPPYAMHVDAPEDALKVLARGTPVDLEERLVTNTSHALDLMTYFAGPAKEVVALPGRKLLGSARVDYLSLIAFQSGIHASFSSHWRSPGDWTMVLYGHDYKITIHLRQNTCQLEHGGRTISVPPAPEDLRVKPGVLRQDEAFLDAITAGRPAEAPLCSLDDAIESLRLAELLQTNHTR